MAFDFGIKNISLDGFRIVNSMYFTHQAEPSMTIWETAISFNAASHAAFNDCDAIEIYVNEKSRCILIKPALSKEPEAVQWKKGKDGTYYKMECSAFARRLFDLWKLNTKYHYRAFGKTVQCEKKLMMLFDFSKNDALCGSKLVKENG